MAEPMEFLFDGDAPRRLDHFLTSALGEYSRNRIQTWIRSGRVAVDGSTVRKTGHSVEYGARVLVDIPPIKPADIQAENIPLDVIFENDQVLVVNKPAGMVVHPSAGHSTGTLVNAALAHDPNIIGVGGRKRPGVVHRLDKETSGVLLLAKDDHSHQVLQDQFRNRTVSKKYLGLVEGRPPTPTGVVQAEIGRDNHNRKRMAVVPEGRGRKAITYFTCLEPFEGYSLLEIRPETGRTHQIRVHMAFLRCPIVGDRLYGRKKLSLNLTRHFLHASSLEIRIPKETSKREFSAPLPPELENVLVHLRETLDS